MSGFGHNGRVDPRPTLPPIRDWFAEELAGTSPNVFPQLRSLELSSQSSEPSSSTSFPSPHGGRIPHRTPSSRPCVSPSSSGSSPRHQPWSPARPIAEPPVFNREEQRVHQSRNLHRNFDNLSSVDVGMRGTGILSSSMSASQYSNPAQQLTGSTMAYQSPVNRVNASSSHIFRSSPPAHSSYLSVPDRTVNTYPMSSDDALEAKYECPHCGKGFTRPSSLKIHLNSHTGEKRTSCACLARVTQDVRCD